MEKAEDWEGEEVEEEFLSTYDKNIMAIWLTISCTGECCGFKYIEFGSGSRILYPDPG